MFSRSSIVDNTVETFTVIEKIEALWGIKPSYAILGKHLIGQYTVQYICYSQHIYTAFRLIHLHAHTVRLNH